MIAVEKTTTPLKELKDIPHLGGLPVIGQPLKFQANPGNYLFEGYQRHGDIFRLNLMGMKMVCMLGPDANRLIMSTKRLNFSHAQGYAFVTTLLGDGLLFQDGELHARNRDLMMPAFNTKGVKTYFDLMHEISSQYIEQWSREGMSSMYERLRYLTFDVMGKLILGVELEQDIKHLGELNDLLAKAAVAIPYRYLPFSPYKKGLRAKEEIVSYLLQVIAKRRSGERREDALGLLLQAKSESGEVLSDEELVGQIIILMFAGHETTMSMLTAALELFKQNPGVLERIRHERDELVGDSALTLEHLKKMEYLDCALKEVERVRPPIPLIMRGVVEDTEFKGYRIPAGTTILMSPAASQRIPGVFNDPEKFDPERFMQPRVEHRATPYSLVGFGGGPRLCLGRAFSLMEMKVVLCLLLKDYDWILAGNTPDIKYLPTAYPTCGLPGKIVPRNRSN